MTVAQAATLTDLAQALRGQDGQDKTLETSLKQICELLPEGDAASITLRRPDGRLDTLAPTDETVADLDRLQYELREGPCLSAALEDEWYRSGDIASDGRWPTWGPHAAEAGFRSMLAVPLSDSDQIQGAINVYSHERDAFTDRDDIHFVCLYAVHLSMAVGTTRQVEGLRTALDSRHTIGLAQGILMERFDLDVAKSFELLRRYSSVLNIKLHTIAADLVESRRLPEFPDRHKD